MTGPILSEKYHIVSQIGEGIFGKTYLAREKNTSELAVIKIIENDNFWENIKASQQVLYSIDNEYIVRIYGMEVIGSYKCFIQEYVDGIDLNTYVLNNNLTLRDLLNISFGMLKALEYLEPLSLSHKDIKPSNIVYDSDKNVAKLIDLDYTSISVLSNQNYMGTIKYSAPEQLIDNRPSNKADIYSAGMVVCFMILGDIPFNIDLKKTAVQIKKEVATALRAIGGLKREIVKRILDLVNGLLEYSAAKRLSPSKAIHQVEDIIKICEEVNQQDIVLHKFTNPWDYSSNAPFYFDSTLEVTALLVSDTELNADNIRREFLEETLCGMVRSENSRENSEFANLNKNRENDQNIYHEQLRREYENILLQAKISFGLWVFSFFVCFGIIFSSVFSIIKGNYIEGLITVVLDGAVMAIQKLFNIREDHYRELMEQKIKHLEVGDYFDYAFEKVEKLDNREDKKKEIEKLLHDIRAHAAEVERKK